MVAVASTSGVGTETPPRIRVRRCGRERVGRVVAGRYAVTGGTGFLGTEVCRRLAKDGHTIRLLVRKPDGIARIRRMVLEHGGEVEVIEGDIGDQDAWGKVFSGQDSVDGLFHLAGIVIHSRRSEAEKELREVNVESAIMAVRAAEIAGVRRVVIASTSGVCAVTAGNEEPAVLGDDAPFADEVVSRWPYYKSKIDMEREISSLTNDRSVEVVFIRPSLLLGPGDTRLSSCGSVRGLMLNAIPLIPRGGINFVDVRDVADAIVESMHRGKAGSSYLVGGENMRLKHFFKETCAIAGSRMPFLSLPAWLAEISAKIVSGILGLIGMRMPLLDPVFAEMGNAFWYLDASRAKKEVREVVVVGRGGGEGLIRFLLSSGQLNFSPRPWQETLRDTVKWIRHNAI